MYEGGEKKGSENSLGTVVKNAGVCSPVSAKVNFHFHSAQAFGLTFS